jgi:5,6-dimethylbenzimidazole synthase
MTSGSPPVFDATFREQLTALLAWRRDVRRFRETPVPEALIDELLDLVQLSPSVGNSQPWRWVRVESPDKRAAVRANFRDCNARAQAAQPDEHAEAYAALKLTGMDRAPLQFAVFCDKETAQGHGLGQRTMPETAEYSTTNMIATFWLVARAVGLGVGWVSILDPERVSQDLAVPPA